MRERPRYALLVVALLALGVVLRLVPLYWSPYPATLDGFRYARLAHVTLQTGQIPVTSIDADELGYTLVLVAGSAVTGMRPLTLAQPLTASVGAAVPLVGVVLARWAGRDLGWSPRRTYHAAAVAGLALALDGLFVRRTGVPDEEALGLLLVPVLALACQRALRTRRVRWVGATLLVMGVFPLVHNLSSIIGALTVTALVALWLTDVHSSLAALSGVALVGGFWTWAFGYFAWAETTLLDVTYSGLIRDHPGLFVAWVVLLVVGVVWTRSLSARGQAAAVAAPLGIAFLVVVANLVRPVFPGTVQTPPLVLAVVAPLVLAVAVLGARGLPRTSNESRDLLLALFGAPIVMVFYALTAALTPQFFGAVMRIQTFAHPPALVLAALGAVAIGSRTSASMGNRPYRGARVAVVGFLIVAAAVSIPFAYLNLDTGTYPSTTLESEFEAASFAAHHVNGTVATDHTISRVMIHYFPGSANPSMAPTITWLRGGPPPACPMLMQASWTESGAHLFPTPPATVSDRRYQAVVAHRTLVYTATGRDPLVLTRPLNETTVDC